VAIRDYVEKNPDLATTIKTSFQFKLKSPESGYYLDLKSSPAKVEAGDIASPDVTLELTDEDFLAMTTGGADAQKLYFAGKLKIGGNVMASQKLMFLKKVDPKAAEAAIAKAPRGERRRCERGTGRRRRSAKAPEVFKALGERLAKNPALGGARRGGAVQGHGPRRGRSMAKSPATVAEGATGGGGLPDPVRRRPRGARGGAADAKALFQHGKLRSTETCGWRTASAVMKGS
jgi:putative sterol carrier protein